VDLLTFSEKITYTCLSYPCGVLCHMNIYMYISNIIFSRRNFFIYSNCIIIHEMLKLSVLSSLSIRKICKHWFTKISLATGITQLCALHLDRFRSLGKFIFPHLFLILFPRSIIYWHKTYFKQGGKSLLFSLILTYALNMA
jgi:hypothetical protein